MFTTGQDKNLELLTRGPAPRHHVPAYGKSPNYPVDPSTSGRAYSGLNPYAGSYYLSAMTSQGFPIGTPIFQPPDGTSGSSSGVSLDRDCVEDYPEIGDIICWHPAVED
jgi:hypothetical protein